MLSSVVAKATPRSVERNRNEHESYGSLRCAALLLCSSSVLPLIGVM